MPEILIAVLAVIFVLGVAINIHEFGHFIVAKMLGMRVEAYSFFGIGPRLFGFRVGDTDYRVSAAPIGAYVKLYGEDNGGLEGKDANGEIVPESQLYELRPRWQKFLVMIGGPVMNIILALAIPFVGAMMYGVPVTPTPTAGYVKAGGAADKAGIKEGDRVIKFDGVENPTWQRINNDAMILQDKDVPLTVERDGKPVDLTIRPARVERGNAAVGDLEFQPSELVIVKSPVPDSPAANAGLKTGDRIIALNGKTVSGIENFKALIQENKTAPVTIALIRNEQRQEITLTPKITDSGNAIIGANLSSESLVREKSTIGQSAAFAFNANLEIIRLTGKVFGQLFSGQRSVKDAGLAGTVGIVQLIVQVVREAGFAGLISLLALISLNLGVFNLLPIPLLDGGQITVLGIEEVLSWFGKKLSMVIKERIQFAGLAIILTLLVFTTYLDISRMFGK